MKSGSILARYFPPYNSGYGVLNDVLEGDVERMLSFEGFEFTLDSVQGAMLGLDCFVLTGTSEFEPAVIIAS